MNDSPLNEKIFDSKIWKKDSQDESIFSLEKNDKNKNGSINKTHKKSKNSSLNSNTNSSGGVSMNNNSDYNNNSSNGNSNTVSISNNNKKNNGNNTIQKKLTLPISSIPYSLKMKKDMNKNNNNINKLKKPIGTKNYLQILPTYNIKTKEQNSNLFQKIKDKISKETKIDNKNKIKEKLETNSQIKKKIINKPSNKEVNKEGKNEIKKEKQQQANNINEKGNIIMGDEEEFGDGQDDEILQINKVQSIDVKSNFIKNNYLQSSQAYYSNPNSSNNSNKSQTKQKCYIESDDSNNKSNLNDPPSGRSNNSSNTFLTANSYQGNNTDINNPYSGAFYFSNILNNQNNNINSNTNAYFFPKKNSTLMSSFLSTGTNSYHSGQRFDTSNSNESSGQSPQNFNIMQRQFSNNNINSNYIMQLNPIKNYTNIFNSKELPFRQPFSLNTSFYSKNYKNNLFSSNTKPKEKQIINLENVAKGIEKRTTIMIRNVPIKYKTEHLEKELLYFYGKFDCLYLPLDINHDGNKGYAFLNLINPYHVLMFYEVFQGKCWSFFESKKICELNFANFQGIAEITKHAKHYKTQKPKFYNIKNNNNSSIEVPKKYLHLILEKNPNLKYHENKNIIIINSFN